MINQPIFCITSDVDWASPFCTANLINLLQGHGITPTLFATHECPVIKAFNEAHPDDVGIHPNFLENSTHGNGRTTVIKHLFELFPNARTFRAHSFFDSSDILQEMAKRGVAYDSNLCLYLQPNVVPLQLSVPGITRLPVFWEDDDHWLHTGGEWEFRKFADAFFTPGLKIINVHPFFVAANIPSADYYENVKQHIATLSINDLDMVRHAGRGVQTFLVEFIEFVKSHNQRFYTLNEIYHMFPVQSLLVSGDDTQGRNTSHSDEEYKKYWQMNDLEKQNFIKASFEQRNATDKYATSRDFHARELEIEAIGQGIPGSGTIVDLGCGNGYTLISLAKKLKDCTMIGVDFSENLIDGAKLLFEKERGELQSHPDFICGDAISYINDVKDDSVDYVITERFIQNMPSVECQKKIVRQVYRVLRKGGRLLMCEGSEDGFNNLNKLRKQVGLAVIPATSADNVSAIRIVDREFEDYAQREIGFKTLSKLGFSQYFILSRVFHPLFVMPLSPRFDSNFNTLAMRIQENTEFAPGYGSNVVWVLEK